MFMDIITFDLDVGLRRLRRALSVVLAQGELEALRAALDDELPFNVNGSIHERRISDIELFQFHDQAVTVEVRSYDPAMTHAIEDHLQQPNFISSLRNQTKNSANALMVNPEAEIRYHIRRQTIDAPFPPPEPPSPPPSSPPIPSPPPSSPPPPSPPSPPSPPPSVPPSPPPPSPPDARRPARRRRPFRRRSRRRRRRRRRRHRRRRPPRPPSPPPPLVDPADARLSPPLATRAPTTTWALRA